MRNATTVELGPDNWFDAWWLTGRERCATKLLRDEAGSLTLLALEHDELKLVSSVLVRAWCEGPRDWQAPEWSELQELEARGLEQLDALRRRGGEAEPVAGAKLVLPPTDHAMFASDAAALLLAECWRLEGHPVFLAWLTAAVKARNFAVQARSNVNLRRIAVEAAKRAPGPETFDVLRRIYRDARSRSRVVEADQEFLARGAGADSFRNSIEEFGLHAEFAKERFASGRRAKAKASAGSPRITVLIPSYRHEAYVQAAIESCLRQTIGDVRVLVADDKSPDGTVAVARAIDDPRLTVTENRENLGLGASVLQALQQVDTPYVALLNSDDLFHPDRLQRCLAALEGDDAAMLVATGFAVVDRDGRLLTKTTSCAAEIGPNAHGWLRWHAGIVRDELHRPEDWVAFEVLLRHNVLATSSNMVFRTDWLRAHMPEASRLKYCVDWQLFLQAAMEGSLRMVEGALLAYRLHDANTVWFREGGRTDYVLEVNRVVDRVLGQWLERAVVRLGAKTAVDQLAQLLEHDARTHGEVDGLALYLEELAKRYAGGQVDSGAESLVTLVETALRRKAYGQVMANLKVDPWSLPWRVQLADRWRLEHDVADGFTARSRSLTEAGDRLRAELQRALARQQELDAEKARIDSELVATRQAKVGVEEERARLQATTARQAEQLGKLQLETDSQRAKVAALQASVDSQRAELTALVQQQAEARRDAQRMTAQLQQAARSLDLLQQEIAGLEAERDRRGERVVLLEAVAEKLAGQFEAARGEASRRLSEVRERERAIAALRAERDEFENELRIATADRDRERRLRDRAVAIALAERRQLSARTRSPSWRLGDVLMRRVGVLGTYKTMASWARWGGALAHRGAWHVQRLATAEGRARSGITVFADIRDGATIDERCLRWPGAGDGTCRVVVPGGQVSAAELRGVARASMLADDARLAQQDRSYFHRRLPAVVEQIERQFVASPWLPRAWRGARLAKATGTGVTIAQGLRGGAVQGFASKLLCGTRLTLVLGDEDLIDPGVDEAGAKTLLRAADLLVVDSERVLRAAEQIAAFTANQSLIRWAIEPGELLPTRQPGPKLRAFVQWPACRRADPSTLVAGVQQAVAAGCDLELDVVGSLGEGERGLLRWLQFQDEIAAAGLTARCHLHGESTRASRRQLLLDADLALWIGRPSVGAGLPDLVVECLALGKPVIASAVGEICWLPAVAEHVSLVEPGNRLALATTLQRFADERESMLQRLAIGRELMRQRALDEEQSWLAALATCGRAKSCD